MIEISEYGITRSIDKLASFKWLKIHPFQLIKKTLFRKEKGEIGEGWIFQFVRIYRTSNGNRMFE
jgi:hypothetical protein